MGLAKNSGIALLTVGLGIAFTGCAKKKPLPERGTPFAAVQLTDPLKARLETQYGLDPAKICLMGVTLNDDQKSQVIEISAPAPECPTTEVARAPIASLKIWGEWKEPKKASDVPSYLVIGKSELPIQNTPVATIRNGGVSKSAKSDPALEIPSIEITDLCTDLENTSVGHFDLTTHCRIAVDPATKAIQEIKYAEKETLDRALLNVHLIQLARGKQLEATQQLLTAAIAEMREEFRKLGDPIAAHDTTLKRLTREIKQIDVIAVDLQARIDHANSPLELARLNSVKQLADEITQTRAALFTAIATRELNDRRLELDALVRDTDYLKNPDTIAKLAVVSQSLSKMKTTSDLIFSPAQVADRAALSTELDHTLERSDRLLSQATKDKLDAVSQRVDTIVAHHATLEGESTRQFLSEKFNQTDEIHRKLVFALEPAHQASLADELRKARELRDTVARLFDKSAKLERTGLAAQLDALRAKQTTVLEATTAQKIRAVETRIAKIDADVFGFQVLMAKAAANAAGGPREIPNGLTAFATEGNQGEALAQFESRLADLHASAEMLVGVAASPIINHLDAKLSRMVSDYRSVTSENAKKEVAEYLSRLEKIQGLKTDPGYLDAVTALQDATDKATALKEDKDGKMKTAEKQAKALTKSVLEARIAVQKLQVLQLAEKIEAIKRANGAPDALKTEGDRLIELERLIKADEETAANLIP